MAISPCHMPLTESAFVHTSHHSISSVVFRLHNPFINMRKIRVHSEKNAKCLEIGKLICLQKEWMSICCMLGESSSMWWVLLELYRAASLCIVQEKKTTKKLTHDLSECVHKCICGCLSCVWKRLRISKEHRSYIFRWWHVKEYLARGDFLSCTCSILKEGWFISTLAELGDSFGSSWW